MCNFTFFIVQSRGIHVSHKQNYSTYLLPNYFIWPSVEQVVVGNYPNYNIFTFPKCIRSNKEERKLHCELTIDECLKPARRVSHHGIAELSGIPSNGILQLKY